MCIYRQILPFLLVLCIPITSLWAAPNQPAQEALKRLIAGNQRFYQGKSIHPDQDAERRKEISPSQNPYVVILGCADSRVPPEVIFDQGLGDVFGVRIAGNIADDATIGSIEFAVEALNVPLIVVLGHERCGAVKAALMNEKVQGDAALIVEQIKKIIAPVRGMPGNALDNAIRANVVYAMSAIRKNSPVLSAAYDNQQLMIVGAIYDLDTGIVEFLK